MHKLFFLILVPLWIQAQSNSLDTNIYFSFDVNVSSPIFQRLEEDDASIHGLGIGYCFNFDKMLWKNSLGFSIKYLRQTYSINTIHDYSYTTGILQVPANAPIMDPEAQLKSYNLLFGATYQFDIDKKSFYSQKLWEALILTYSAVSA